MDPKSLGNTDANGTTKNVPDVVFFGDGDTFKLLCKASSHAQGWMKSTKAMEIPGVGCVVQVTTQQRNPDGSYAVAEAVTFVPGVTIALTFKDRYPDPPYATGRTLRRLTWLDRVWLALTGRTHAIQPSAPQRLAIVERP